MKPKILLSPLIKMLEKIKSNLKFYSTSYCEIFFPLCYCSSYCEILLKFYSSSYSEILFSLSYCSLYCEILSPFATVPLFLSPFGDHSSYTVPLFLSPLGYSNSYSEILSPLGTALLFASSQRFFLTNTIHTLFVLNLYI